MMGVVGGIVHNVKSERNLVTKLVDLLLSELISRSDMGIVVTHLINTLPPHFVPPTYVHVEAVADMMREMGES
jgi:hypothetical protein